MEKRKEEREKEKEKLNNRCPLLTFFTQLSGWLAPLNRNFSNGSFDFISRSSDCPRTLSNLETSRIGIELRDSIPVRCSIYNADDSVDPHAYHVLRSAGCGLANIVSGSITRLSTSIVAVFVYTSGSIELRHHCNWIKQ